MNFKSYVWIVSLLLVSLFWGCRSALDEKLGCTDPRSLNYDENAVYDSGDCDYSDSYRYYMPEFWSEEDDNGNLMVVNQTESPLHLFAERTHLKVVPPKTEEFLVDIPVKTDVTQLSLYRAEDVDYIETPPEEKFKSWRVVLKATALADVPVGWVVSDLVTGDGSGSLILSYPEAEADDNRLPCNVDVYIHSKTGGRITTIEPGTDDKEVRIDFGTYRFWFHYWDSDPNSPEGFQSLGWKSTSDIVLNANYEVRNIEIPSFDVIPENAAALNVINHSGEVINLKLGDRLIEDLVLGRENTQGMSTIANRDSMIYPVENGQYLLSFEGLKGNEIGTGFYVDLNEHFATQIFAGQTRQSISINNQTDQKLFLGAEHYLGVSVNAMETRDASIPGDINEISVFSADSAFFREVSIDSGILNIE